MKIAVAALPSGDGLKVRGPIARLTIATVSTMPTSRLMTRIGQPQRDAVDEADVRQRQHDEGRHQQQLVGRGIEPGAELALLPRRARGQAVEQIGQRRRTTKIASAQPNSP